MNQNVSVGADCNSDYDYSFTVTRGGERGEMA